MCLALYWEPGDTAANQEDVLPGLMELVACAEGRH